MIMKVRKWLELLLDASKTGDAEPRVLRACSPRS